jgi:hypothetical protein
MMSVEGYEEMPRVEKEVTRKLHDSRFFVRYSVFIDRLVSVGMCGGAC